MKVLWMSIFGVLLTFIIILTILFGVTSVVGDPSIDTTISISPPTQTVGPGENFTVDVYCVPGQPIKAFELKLSFNPSRVKAINVTEGNIFNGYSTFFNEGDINNNAGTITDIYGLILGEGNVIDPGTFVTISFISKETSGSYSLDMSDVGVTDEIGYVSIDVSDGTVSVKITNDDPPPPPGGGGGPPPSGDEENNPPMMPLQPSGPTFVELGVEYTFFSSTYDIDGDQVRYMFEWGDGNYSNWSGFKASNITVSMSHTFSSTSTFDVRVVAQDVNGLNSSWSAPLNVTVSQLISGNKLPVANFSVSGILSVNGTIIFDGSGSFDEDGVIVLYYWDFGDGANGSGINISHTYHNRGEYPVTLVVTDNDGYTYSKTILVTVFSEIEEEKLGEDQSVVIVPFDFSIIFVVLIIVLFTFLAFLLRDNIKSFASIFSQFIRLFSLRKIWNARNFVNKRDGSVEKIRNRMMGSTDFKQFPYIKLDIQSFKNYYFKDKVDKLEGLERQPDKFFSGSSKSTGFEDIESQVDNIILSNEIDYLDKFDIGKKRMSSKLGSNDIDRLVDDLIASKTQKENDSL